jgi:hypothetical protein
MKNFWRRLRCIAEACLKREGLAFLAFCASFGAGVVLTAMLAWNILYLQEEKRSDDIAYLAFGMLALLGITQLSLHRLLGSKQAIQLEFWKLKATMSQGDDMPTGGQ